MKNLIYSFIIIFSFIQCSYGAKVGDYIKIAQNSKSDSKVLDINSNSVIKILKERDESNTLKFYENKFNDRVYPSLCCIEKVFVNDLDYSFKLNNIWKKIW